MAPRSYSLTYSSGILITLSGLSTEAQGSSVDIPVPLPHQSFVVVRRIDLVDHRRIVDRDRHHFLLMLMQDCSRARARRVRALQQLAEQRVPPDHGMAPPFSKRRDDGGRAGSTVRLED